jgi:hypothetical protein
MADQEYPTKLPKSVPQGKVLVHNHVHRPTRTQGVRGSRYWLQPPADNLIVCTCAFAPELGTHYRVARPESGAQ